MIGFLIRAAFWFTIVLLVLPFAQSRPESREAASAAPLAQPQPQQEVSSQEAVTALQGAVSDVSGFCDRQADACDAGRSVLSALGTRLRDGAATLAYILDEALEGKEDGGTGLPPSATGTLTPDDRAPEWRAGGGDKRPPV